MNYTVLIVYHKQATSARTRFLRGPNSCLFSIDFAPGVTPNPRSVVWSVAEAIGIPPASLEFEEGFRETAASGRTVYLARAIDIDPPKTVHPEKFRFISLMDVRDLPPEELDLLGVAYQMVMGG